MRVSNPKAWHRFITCYEHAVDWAAVTSCTRVQGGLLISSAHGPTLDEIAWYAGAVGLTVERSEGAVKVRAL